MIKEVRRTFFQSTDGNTRPVVTYRHKRGIFSGEYEVRVFSPATRLRIYPPCHEVSAIGKHRSARNAEQIALAKLRQSEERSKHY